MSLKITLIRAEGPTAECGIFFDAASFFDADLKLKSWSWSAPKAGGYDKCDFWIVDAATGVNYEGRYDLKHWSVELPDLKAGVVRYLEYVATEDTRASASLKEQAAALAIFMKGQQ